MYGMELPAAGPEFQWTPPSPKQAAGWAAAAAFLGHVRAGDVAVAGRLRAVGLDAALADRVRRGRLLLLLHLGHFRGARLGPEGVLEVAGHLMRPAGLGIGRRDPL